MLKNIIEAFSSDRYIVVQFGSQSSRESDVLIIDQNSESEFIADGMNSFVNTFSTVSSEDDCRIIVSHEHRAYVGNDEHSIHFLYYPSKNHLMSWELPSFLSYLLYSASVLQGDLSFLGSTASAYEKRDMPPCCNDLFALHLHVYDKIATDSLIYALDGSRFYSIALLSENIGYALRFMLAEFFQTIKVAQLNRDAWSWNSIIDAAEKHLPRRLKLLEILRRSRNHVPSSTMESVVEDILEYFSARDYIMRIINEEHCHDSTC